MACETALRMNIPSASGRTLSCSARPPERDPCRRERVQGGAGEPAQREAHKHMLHLPPRLSMFREPPPVYSLRPPPNPAPRRLGGKRDAFRSSTKKRSTSSGAVCSTGRSATAGAAGNKAGKTERLGVAGQGGQSINAAQGLPEILFLEGCLYLLDFPPQSRAIACTSIRADNGFSAVDPEGCPLPSPESGYAPTDGGTQGLPLSSGSTSAGPGGVEEQPVRESHRFPCGVLQMSARVRKHGVRQGSAAAGDLHMQLVRDGGDGAKPLVKGCPGHLAPPLYVPGGALHHPWHFRAGTSDGALLAGLLRGGPHWGSGACFTRRWPRRGAAPASSQGLCGQARLRGAYVA